MINNHLKEPGNPPKPVKFLGVSQVAKRLGLAPRTVRHLAQHHKLAGEKRGPKLWFFPEPAVTSYAEDLHWRRAQ